MTAPRDRLYADTRDAVEPFRFDATVARVFPDMIRRSVPGYATMVAMTGVIAGRHAQPGSTLHDLGCSLGAVTLAMRQSLAARGDRGAGCRLVAVDTSTAMLDRARLLLAESGPGLPVEFRAEDIRDTRYGQASVVALNFTLQFVPLEDRMALLSRIRAGMLPGGALVLSEKIRFDDPDEQALNDALHLDFKRAEGYSELEIAQKRTALENVLVPETVDTHVERLHAAGFADVTCWFRCFNFASLIARVPA